MTRLRKLFGYLLLGTLVIGCGGDSTGVDDTEAAKSTVLHLAGLCTFEGLPAEGAEVRLFGARDECNYLTGEYDQIDLSVTTGADGRYDIETQVSCTRGEHLNICFRLTAVSPSIPPEGNRYGLQPASYGWQDMYCTEEVQTFDFGFIR